VLSTRVYDHTVGRLGAFVGEGAVTLLEFTTHTRGSTDVPADHGDLVAASPA